MKRLLVLAALLGGTAAIAEWYPVSVPGTVNDVTIVAVDGGRFVVASSSGLYEFRDGGVVQTFAQGTNMTWGTADGGCLIGITRFAPPEYRSTCAAPVPLVSSPAIGSVLRVANLGTTKYFYGTNSFTSINLYFEDTTGVVNSVSFGSNLVPTVPQSIAGFQSGGQSYAVFPAGPPRLGFLRDATDRGRYDAGLVGLDVTTFVDGINRSALVGTSAVNGSDAIAITSMLPLAPPPLERAVTPSDVSRVTGVAFTSQTNTSGTNSIADGFGMACSGLTDGGTSILQPIPDPGNPARAWVPNGNQSSVRGALTRVVCREGKLCVVMTSLSAGNNLYVYENRSAPRFPAAANATVASSGVVTVDLAAVDDDGDPIRYGLFSATPDDAGTTRQLDAGLLEFTAQPYCGAAKTVTVANAASDGVYAATGSVQLTITPGTVGAPIASTSISVQAGSDAGRIDVGAGMGECAPTEFSWTLLDGGGLFAAVLDAGNSRVFVPPANYCSATPGEAVYSVTASSGPVTSPPTIVSAQLLPWGAPEKPFAADLNLFIDAGESVVLTRDGGHFCANAPVATTWSLPIVDGGVRANGVPLVFSRDEVADSLTLSTAPCINAVFDIPVSNAVGNQTSATPDPVVRVTVSSNLTAGNVAISKLTAVEFDGGLLVTTGADFVCAGSLGYSAHVSVSKDGTVLRDAGVLFTPTEGSLFVPFVDCAGGAYDVNAFLVNPDGGLTTISQSIRANIAPGTVPAPNVLVEESSSACDVGGRAVLSVLPQSRCPGLSYRWTPLPGLELEPIDGTSDSVTVRTRSTQLSDILGQRVSIQVTPVSGNRSFPSTLADVTFAIQPFVEVEHLTDAPVTSDAELFGVTVNLTNTLDCEVSNVDYVESLDQTRVVPSSIRINGAKVDPDRIVFGSRSMAIRGLTLPPGEKVRVYFSARSVLFGSAKPTGKAVLRFSDATEYDISEESGFARAPGSNPPGCGCGAVSLQSLLALLGAARLLRRRRTPARQSAA